MFALVLVFPFLLLVLLRLDTVLLLKLLQSQRVGHEGLVSGLFLLLDSEQRIFPDFGGCIPRSVCKLCGNEVLVRGADLWEGVINRVAGPLEANSPCRSHLP